MKSSLPGISLRNLHFNQNGHEILKNVSFHAPLGEITCLFGPSGAGKTTCLRLIAGLETAKQGEIQFDGSPSNLSKNSTQSKQITAGYCFQDDGLWPGLRVDEHLRIALKAFPISKEDREEKIKQMLERFHLIPLAKQFPDQLSGGEQKRLAFARAMILEPEILLLDEPLASIEGMLRQEFSDLIDATKSPERAVIFVSHHLQEALALSDRLVILHGGAILREDAAYEVYHNPQSIPVAKLMGYHNFYDIEVQDGKLMTPFHEIQNVFNEKQIHKVHAASLLEDIEAEPDGQGEAIVQYCRLAGRYYMVRVRLKQNTFMAFARQLLHQEQRVRLSLRNPPVLLGNEL